MVPLHLTMIYTLSLNITIASDSSRPPLLLTRSRHHDDGQAPPYPGGGDAGPAGLPPADRAPWEGQASLHHTEEVNTGQNSLKAPPLIRALSPASVFCLLLTETASCTPSFFRTVRHTQPTAPSAPAPGEYEIPEVWRTGTAFTMMGRVQVRHRAGAGEARGGRGFISIVSSPAPASPISLSCPGSTQS